MKKWSGAAKIICFLAIGAALFFRLQDVVTPSFEGRTISAFVDLEEKSVDVLFLGTSHVLRGVSPMQIYDQTYIRSYNLGTSAQPIECSYYLLKRALQKQDLQVVVLDVSRLFVNERSDFAWRWILEDLPLDSLKVEMAETYGEDVNEGEMLSALFPMIQYHTRWNELTATDMIPTGMVSYYSAGQLVTSQISGTSLTKEYVDYEVGKIQQLGMSGYATHLHDGEENTEKGTNTLYNPTIGDYNRKWLYKMQELCEENGVELILVKIPVISYPSPSSTGWNQARHDEVVPIAEELGLTFIDFMYGTDIGIDFTTDTMDGGGHLNFLGAEKVSNYLARYLAEHYALTREAHPVYEYNLELYRQVCEVVELQTELDFTAYLRRLQENRENLTILFAGRKNIVPGLTEEDYALLESMGLELLDDVKQHDAYLAVLEQGVCTYEGTSNHQISHQTTVDGKQAGMTSPSWNADGNIEISVDGAQHAVKEVGLNIVVYDHTYGMVIDSVVFNTGTEQKTASRNSELVNQYLRSVEDKVCFSQEGDA